MDATNLIKIINQSNWDIHIFDDGEIEISREGLLGDYFSFTVETSNLPNNIIKYVERWSIDEYTDMLWENRKSLRFNNYTMREIVEGAEFIKHKLCDLATSIQITNK